MAKSRNLTLKPLGLETAIFIKRSIKEMICFKRRSQIQKITTLMRRNINEICYLLVFFLLYFIYVLTDCVDCESKTIVVYENTLRIISKTDVCDEIHLEALAQPVFFAEKHLK